MFVRLPSVRVNQGACLLAVLPHRGGGIFFTPYGKIETYLSWGLGTESNNIIEALALWQGLVIAKNKRINKLIVLGDSRIVIQEIVKGTLPNQLHLRQLIKKIQVLALYFHKIDFYHILRIHNKEANLAANVGTTLIPGSLLINGFQTKCDPP